MFAKEILSLRPFWWIRRAQLIAEGVILALSATRVIGYQYRRKLRRAERRGADRISPLSTFRILLFFLAPPALRASYTLAYGP